MPSQVENSILDKSEEVQKLRNALENAKRQGAESDEKAAEANAAGTLAVATADLMQARVQPTNVDNNTCMSRCLSVQEFDFKAWLFPGGHVLQLPS